MIYDTLDHISQYEGIQDRIMTGLRFLAETDFSTWADGTFELDSDRIKVLLLSYTTRTENNTPEAHKSYLDIQYLIEGEEIFGVAPVEEMTELVEAHPDRDVWFYRGPVEQVLVSGKRFIALWPGDAHAPEIAPKGLPSPCRKCVVKVKLED